MGPEGNEFFGGGSGVAREVKRGSISSRKSLQEMGVDDLLGRANKVAFGIIRRLQEEGVIDKDLSDNHVINSDLFKELMSYLEGSVRIGISRGDSKGYRDACVRYTRKGEYMVVLNLYSLDLRGVEVQIPIKGFNRNTLNYVDKQNYVRYFEGRELAERNGERSGLSSSFLRGQNKDLIERMKLDEYIRKMSSKDNFEDCLKYFTENIIGWIKWMHTEFDDSFVENSPTSDYISSIIRWKEDRLEGFFVNLKAVEPRLSLSEVENFIFKDFVDFSSDSYNRAMVRAIDQKNTALMTLLESSDYAVRMFIKEFLKYKF
ncbi:MAG: hypothetical protein WCX95_02570 [Candidatus Gracilibacteria bacterium]